MNMEKLSYNCRKFSVYRLLHEGNRGILCVYRRTFHTFEPYDSHLSHNTKHNGLVAKPEIREKHSAAERYLSSGALKS